MNIAFETEHIREVCLKTECAEKELGESAARALFSVVADIRAAQNAGDLFLAIDVTGEEAGLQKLQLKFAKSGSLVLVSNHAHHNGPDSQRVVWSQVKRVRIVEVLSDDG